MTTPIKRRALRQKKAVNNRRAEMTTIWINHHQHTDDSEVERRVERLLYEIDHSVTERLTTASPSDWPQRHRERRRIQDSVARVRNDVRLIAILSIRKHGWNWSGTVWNGMPYGHFLLGSKPYRHCFSEKYHAVMSHDQYGSQRVAWFSTQNVSEIVCRQGSARQEATALPRYFGWIWGMDPPIQGMDAKGREWGRGKGRQWWEGKGTRCYTSTSFFALPALSRNNTWSTFERYKNKMTESVNHSNLTLTPHLILILTVT